jgi:mannosyltransferase OCH1-like enzyme
MCYKELGPIEEHSLNWKKLNPEYEVKLYDDKMCEEFLLDNFSQLHCDIFKFIPDGPIKADFWRCCVLYKNGGLYVDADIEPIVPLRDYIDNDAQFVIPRELPYLNIYNPHFIMSHPDEPILKLWIDVYVDYYNRKKEYKYWDWSIVYIQNSILTYIATIINNNDNIYIINNKKYQILHQKQGGEKDDHCERYCTNNNIPIFNNSYNFYRDHTFNNISDGIYTVSHYIYNEKYTYMNDHNLIFTKVYNENYWNSINSNNKNYKGSSGPGSTLEYNKDTYIPFLKEFIRNNNIKTVIDLGCGDFICGNAIYDDLDIIYNGYDTYDKLIEYHKSRHINTKYNFIDLDFFNKKDIIISGDLCIMKDVLQHWSVKDIHIFLNYIIHKKLFKFILIINCCNQHNDYNEDSKNVTGGWYELSANYKPLKLYNPTIVYKYHTKEVSLISL